MTLSESLHLNAPWLLLVAGLFLPALGIELRRKPPGQSVAVVGVDALRHRQTGLATRKRLLRAALLAVMAGLLGLAWAAPVLQSSRPLLTVDDIVRQKDIILAIDVSRSMSGPLELPDRQARLAAFGKVRADVEPAQSRYEAARDTAYRFVARFPDARIGLILFSTEPFLARWPTTETEHRFIEVLEEDLRALSQLRRFSSLTNTDDALRLAGEVFALLETSRGGAVVHVSDAEDEFENMGLAIRALRSEGVRLYTIGVGISESVVEKLSGEFSGDPGFRVFRVDSEQEMQQAYRLVAELEESPRYTQAENAYVSDLRWIIALLLAVCSLPAVWLLEVWLARSHIMHSTERRTG
ncbi:MAG: VWA domain-containing protein [Gammaproteobacteria bacterium]|nr:VWA domain-containing protein [Gammaproteobacteria bacterium]